MPAAPPARPIQLSPNGTTLAGPTAQMLPSGLLAVPAKARRRLAHKDGGAGAAEQPPHPSPRRPVLGTMDPNSPRHPPHPLGAKAGGATLLARGLPVGCSSSPLRSPKASPRASRGLGLESRYPAPAPAPIP
eukprot:COSAG01_NODE_2890_length_6906_cov_23.470545_10_plen_131_part_01